MKRKQHYQVSLVVGLDAASMKEAAAAFFRSLTDERLNIVTVIPVTQSTRGKAKLGKAKQVKVNRQTLAPTPPPDTTTPIEEIAHDIGSGTVRA